MALPLLPIASGAVKLGQKIFGGIKKRQAKKAEKRAAKQEKTNAKISSLENLLGGGGGGGATTPVQQGAQGLISNFLSGGVSSVPVDVAPNAELVRENRLLSGGGGNQNMILIIVAALFAILFLGRRR